MSFVTALALGIALLVVAPILAHRLRRKAADVRPFAAARLVPSMPPKARKRSKIEDRGLLAIRAATVVVLALLGASPLVRCSRLTLDREGGASVALTIVLDDSASMRAPLGAGPRARFEGAIAGATQLLSSAREGDAVAIVLAGAPPRVWLAPTTDLGAAKAALADATPSDRATDLEGALTLAEGLLKDLPHVDKKVVLLSDLADGNAGGAPLGRGLGVPLVVPMPELAAKTPDCAVLTADRTATTVRVRVACSPGEGFAGRAIEVTSAGKAVASSPGVASQNAEIVVKIPDNAPDGLVARLATPDAVPSNDAAPVLTESGPSAIAVVVDPTTETTVTGGAPVVEQAFSALHTDLAIRPLPQLPDHAEELSSFAGIVLDDPPGFTPEQRRAIAQFLAGGGVLMVALGPRAAEAPLGATLEPVLTRPPTWEKNTSPGADPKTAHAAFAEPVKSLTELFADKRTRLAEADVSTFERLLTFTDGALLVARRDVGPGEARIVALPFSVDGSDLVLRPGFLALLDDFADAARRHATPRRKEVGAAWLVPTTDVRAVLGPDEKPLPLSKGPDGTRVFPPLVGRYTVKGARDEVRIASFPASELDTSPRATETTANGKKGASVRTQVEIAWALALVLLALGALELAVRALHKPEGAAHPR